MSLYKSHTNETIQYLEQYINAFDDQQDVFKEYWKDKSTIRKVSKVTTWILGENRNIENWNLLSGAAAAKTCQIADEERHDIDEMVANIYDEDVDFNYVKIDWLSYFGDHGGHFGNIKMYSTKSGETSHKTMIKEG